MLLIQTSQHDSHNAPEEQYVCISPSFEQANSGVNLARTNESHLEFVYNDHGKSETVSQEYDTVVTVIVTEVQSFFILAPLFLV